MSDYRSYQHIVRIGDDEVEGILDPFGGATIITVQPKIDGPTPLSGTTMK